MKCVHSNFQASIHGEADVTKVIVTCFRGRSVCFRYMG